MYFKITNTLNKGIQERFVGTGIWIEQVSLFEIINKGVIKFVSLL
jgi:hypothetical protein